MELIKYEGTNNYLIGLVKQEEQLYIFYAKTFAPMISCEEIQDYQKIRNFSFLRSSQKEGKFLVDMKPDNKNNLFHLMEIENEKQYNLIKEVIKDLYD